MQGNDAEIDRKLDLPRVVALVICAVSGSGKTRSIERLLSLHFGFYFQACCVPSNVEGIHSARRIPGSNDTLSLGKMIKLGTMISRGAEDVEPLWIAWWVRFVVSCRFALFGEFLQIATDLDISRISLPRLWFKLQVSSQNDVFDEVFQLACLTQTDINDSNNEERIRSSIGSDKLYFCLDEAQADVDLEIPNPSGSISLLSHWIRKLDDYSRRLSKPHEKVRPLIVSGTSLKTKEVINAITNGGQLPHIPDPDECAVVSTFPAVKDDNQFLQVMVKQGMVRLRRDTDLCTTILEHARPLYGRAGWSARYLQNVRGAPGISLPKERIEEAATRTIEEVFRVVWTSYATVLSLWTICATSLFGVTSWIARRLSTTMTARL
jgi:hypothetical protein